MSRESEKLYIENVLRDYRDEKPSEELREKVYDRLSHEQFLQNISTPFEVILRRDPSRTDFDYIEVVLESKQRA